MACVTCVIVLSWPNLNNGIGFVEKRTAPTRDWVLEMGSVTTMDLMKLSISLKLPRPWYSMLPDPSIRKPKSTTVLHTRTIKDKRVYSDHESFYSFAESTCLNSESHPHHRSYSVPGTQLCVTISY